MASNARVPLRSRVLHRELGVSQEKENCRSCSTPRVHCVRVRVFGDVRETLTLFLSILLLTCTAPQHSTEFRREALHSPSGLTQSWARVYSYLSSLRSTDSTSANKEHSCDVVRRAASLISRHGAGKQRSQVSSYPGCLKLPIGHAPPQRDPRYAIASYTHHHPPCSIRARPRTPTPSDIVATPISRTLYLHTYEITSSW